jgi:hypothetical protein
MPSYERITLVGGPLDGSTTLWDGGDYFEVGKFTYVRQRDDTGRRTAVFRLKDAA